MLEQGDRVLLGVSGGPDSVALLHLLDGRKAQYDIQLFVVHVNHLLRPEAEKEAQYVQQICEEKNIPFRLFTIDVAALAGKTGMSLEQAGHEARFLCFQEAAEAWHITKLALGHHGDDRAESVLLHLVQGCGLEGLTAMPPRDGWLIRPLAQVYKQELVQYCAEHGLRYFTDSTNLEPGCLRNQIRLEVLPQLKQYNPRIAEALLRLQDTCAADADYLEQRTAALRQEYGVLENNQVIFPAELFRTQHTAMQRRMLRYLYRELTGSAVNLTFRQIEQMRHVALQTQGSQQISLHGDVIFIRRYDQLVLRRKQEKPETGSYVWEYKQQPEMKAYASIFVAELAETATQNCGDNCKSHLFCVTADADKLEPMLLIRSRQPGDRLAMPQGHKKLKNFFIEKKVPADMRDQIPLVLSGNEIIWIPGYYVADCVRITGETKRICRLSCQREMFL